MNAPELLEIEAQEVALNVEYQKKLAAIAQAKQAVAEAFRNSELARMQKEEADAHQAAIVAQEAAIADAMKEPINKLDQTLERFQAWQERCNRLAESIKTQSAQLSNEYTEIQADAHQDARHIGHTLAAHDFDHDLLHANDGIRIYHDLAHRINQLIASFDSYSLPSVSFGVERTIDATELRRVAYSVLPLVIGQKNRKWLQVDYPDWRRVIK